MKTWKELAALAINVQDACNLSGVVHTFSETIRDVRALLESEGKGGTDAINTHPVCVMFSSKIASMTGSDRMRDFAEAYDWAKKAAS